MQEIFYYAAKRGGYLSKPDNFSEEEWAAYDRSATLLQETPGFEIKYSALKKKIYIDPTEYQCGIMVLNEEDIESILKEMQPFYKRIYRLKKAVGNLFS